ncbi:uncharacterized protein LOC143590877 isoform X2 [Bidens hawaiensis]|uniref:uncharacterized protein LOC143590877 isoform X2 n=1 Tax=Bidens hawaiensis TaxID=980011 RepID=UPI004048EE9A
MGYKGNSVQGEIPESGAIFMSNIKTHKECLERKLFGLPSGMSDFVLHVKEGMALFLFEFERRLLYGVFRATCDGDINIEPKAFRSSGKQFPAQVRFTTVYDCSPLSEKEFKDVIRDNYYKGKKFHFGLNKKQVTKLMKLFCSKLISRNDPERSIRRYGDNPLDGKARSGDLRGDIRHRIRFDICDSRDDEVKKVDDNMYINKHIIDSRHYMRDSDEFGDSSRRDILGKHLDPRKNDVEDGYMSVFSKSHGTQLDEIGVGSSEFLMDAKSKDIIDTRHYTTESDEFGDCSRRDVLGKHLDLRKNDIEDGYMSVFRKPHGTHLDEIGLGSSEFLMNAENKGIIDYKRLRDEYNIREGIRGSLNEYQLTNHGDIRLSPCFDDGSGFIPIANNSYPVYPSPEKLSVSKSHLHYSYDEGSNQNLYLDDTSSRSSIFPKFISRNLSSPNAGLRVHEADPTYNDKRFIEKHDSKHSFGAIDKRVSVFSRLTMNLRHEEQAFESDEKHELNSSVDKVMKMLEKVVSSPNKRSGKNISVYKQDDADNSPDSKIEVYELSDVNIEVDADMADEEVEGESVFQETRLVDFKRRKKSNKKADGASKENSECLVGATSDVGPVANAELMGMPRKRRKLVRPAFVEKNVVPNSGIAQENILPANDNVDVVLESSEKVDYIIKSMMPTCHENTPADSILTKANVESSKKVDVSIKHIDLNMLPTCDESLSPKDDNNSTKVVLESQKDDHSLTKAVLERQKDDSNLTKAVLESQNRGNERDGNAGSQFVSGVFVKGTEPKDDQNNCGWIEW